tara:strand:- start:49 stop:468 length:420 start_codon:yes stop_codon:yes gene_type:complete
MNTDGFYRQPHKDEPMTEETQEPVSPQETPSAGQPSSESKMLGMLAHLLGIMGFLGPLIIWLIKKDDDPYVDEHGKESLNFQITMMIAFFISGMSTIIFIGCITTPILVVADIILCIMAGMKANEGISYKYPLTIRFIK